MGTELIEKKTADLRSLMLANKDKIAQGIVGNLDPVRAIGIACTEIGKNKKLVDCTPASLFKSINEACQYGWTIGGVLGDAYLVPFGKEATLIPGYKGLMQLVQRAGKCDLTPEVVYENDEYEYRGKLTLPFHKPDQGDGRELTKVKAVYVVVTFPATGMVKTYHMTVGDCLAHRDQYSQGYKRQSNKDNPWHEENPAFATMCKKTLIRRVCCSGEIPMSVDDVALIARRDDGTTIETEAIVAGTFEESNGGPEIPEAEVDKVQADLGLEGGHTTKG